MLSNQLKHSEKHRIKRLKRDQFVCFNHHDLVTRKEERFPSNFFAFECSSGEDVCRRLSSELFFYELLWHNPLTLAPD